MQGGYGGGYGGGAPGGGGGWGPPPGGAPPGGAPPGGAPPGGYGAPPPGGGFGGPPGGMMPPMGAAVGGPEGVREVANYVLSLSGATHDAARAAAGKESFATLCAACHGPQGKGNQGVGAPNLSDATWLYGGDLDSVERSIREGRSGSMPAWGQRLSPTQQHLVAAYVVSLSRGGPAAQR